jgi:hypothetical protein
MGGFDDFAGFALGTISGLETGFDFGLSDDAALGLRGCWRPLVSVRASTWGISPRLCKSARIGATVL